MLEIQVDKLNDIFGHIWDKHRTKLSLYKSESL